MGPIIEYAQSLPPLAWIGGGLALSLSLFGGWRLYRSTRTSVRASHNSTAAGRDIRINDK